MYGLAPKDKTTNLATTNTMLVRSKYSHIPYGSETHAFSPWGTIYDFLQNLLQGQKRIYYKGSSELENVKLFKQWFPNSMYSPLCPLWVNIISVLLDASVQKLVCSNLKWQSFCHVFTTRLVKNAGINTVKSLWSSVTI